jgi:serine protease SohB
MAEPSLFDQVPAALRRFVPVRFRSDIPLVPVVRLSGAIGISSPLKPGLTLGNVARSLERAFTMSNVRAVALSINSPGGAAAQSHLIHRRIRTLADENKVPVFAFVEDVAASGGYMIACAADEIIADASSIVGSIGVVGGSFGFHKLMDKIGVERGSTPRARTRRCSIRSCRKSRKTSSGSRCCSGKFTKALSPW